MTEMYKTEMSEEGGQFCKIKFMQFSFYFFFMSSNVQIGFTFTEQIYDQNSIFM